MALVTWNEKISVGVKSMDDGHKRMIAIMNQLHDGIQAGHSKEVLASVLDQLMNYTVDHFGQEEAYLEQVGYKDIDTHRMQHAQMVYRIVKLQESLKHRPIIMLDLELNGHLQSWFVNHIQGTDMMYSALFIAKKIS